MHITNTHILMWDALTVHLVIDLAVLPIVYFDGMPDVCVTPVIQWVKRIVS